MTHRPIEVAAESRPGQTAGLQRVRNGYVVLKMCGDKLYCPLNGTLVCAGVMLRHGAF